MSKIQKIALGLFLFIVVFEMWITFKTFIFTNKEILARLDECIAMREI